MGFTLQSLTPPQSRTPSGASSLRAVFDIASCCSEDQEVTMTRSFKVFAPCEDPYRPPTRRSRCGRCSLGFSGLSRAMTDRRGTSFPALSLLRFPRTFSRRRRAWRSKALPNGRVALALASGAALVRFSTKARSSVSPEVRGARRANPTRQEYPCAAEPRRSLGTTRGRTSPETVRGALRRAAPTAEHP